jgi:hypothetical protein
VEALPRVIEDHTRAVADLPGTSEAHTGALEAHSGSVQAHLELVRLALYQFRLTLKQPRITMPELRLTLTVPKAGQISEKLLSEYMRASLPTGKFPKVHLLLTFRKFSEKSEKEQKRPPQAWNLQSQITKS